MTMNFIEWCCAYFFLIERQPRNYDNDTYDEESNPFVTYINNSNNDITIDQEYMDEFEEIAEIEQDSMNDWGFWFKI